MSSQSTRAPEKAFTFTPHLSKYNVTAQDYLDTHPDTHVLATGTAVFARENMGQDHLLLVQRSASDSYPGCWEIPGGSVDMTGETILEAAARELREETGLTVRRFVGDMDVVRFCTGRARYERWWLKFAFDVEVAEATTVNDAELEALGTDIVGAKIKLDEREHQAWLWASENDIKNASAGGIKLRFVSSEQKRTMLDAFAQRKECDSEGSGVR
jgi:8-oxo-dGTP pyrophosphatase MutT (NUDIX family)